VKQHERRKKKLHQKTTAGENEEPWPPDFGSLFWMWVTAD
jgi:hypothetical protein